MVWDAMLQQQHAEPVLGDWRARVQAGKKERPLCVLNVDQASGSSPSLLHFKCASGALAAEIRLPYGLHLHQASTSGAHVNLSDSRKNCLQKFGIPCCILLGYVQTSLHLRHDIPIQLFNPSPFLSLQTANDVTQGTSSPGAQACPGTSS